MIWGRDGDLNPDTCFSPITGVRKDLKRDTTLHCSGIETTSYDGCQLDGTGGTGDDGDDCGREAFQTC